MNLTDGAAAFDVSENGTLAYLPVDSYITIVARIQTANRIVRTLHDTHRISDDIRRFDMKWAGMYLAGFVVVIGGLLAGLWKLGVLADIGTTWTVIGVVIAIGLGIMFAVSNSGSRESVEITRK